jgi:hypothetical protein
MDCAWRRKKTKRERRTAAARRQAEKRERERNGVGFYRLKIFHRAIEGMIQQWITTGQVTEEQALRLDRLGIERELARGVEAQGQGWAR